MLKRWTALPREARWLAAGIVAVVLGLAVIWVLFVPVADWLAHHDVGSATGSLHETAVDNARGRLLALGAGLFAAAALVFTARNFTLSREGQVTRARILLKANQGEAGTGWSDRAAYAALPRPYRRAHHDPSATDVVALFAERAADYRAVVRRVAAADVQAAIAAAVGTIPSVLIPDGLPAEWVAGLPADTQLVRDDPPPSPVGPDRIGGVVTGCAVAIAETGTVVLDHGPGLWGSKTGHR